MVRRSAVVPLLLASLLGCHDNTEPGPLDAGSGAVETGDSGELPDLPEPGDGDGVPGDGDGVPGDGDGDGDGAPGDGDGVPAYGPPLYDALHVHSPINAFVQDNLGSIRTLAPLAPADVFMKVGASSTVNQATLYCFADDIVDLDIYAPDLDPTLNYFLLGDAAGTTPFDRVTLAAMIGKTAAWAIAGSPSPLEQEWAAINAEGPSLALVHYGTNDMNMGITYASAMPGFYASMSDLLDQLIDGGIVPVVFGISHRLDSAPADLWVPTYNAVSRGLAQARSIPFVDLHFALEGLPNYGVSADGVHLESYPGGPCIFTPDGLTHGYNVRNLIALQVLDRLYRTLVVHQPINEDAAFLQGLGDLDAPLEIPSLPFADSNSTVAGPSLMFDQYTGCNSTADESGPELIYRLELAETTPIRAMVLDRTGVDIDIHLLDDSGSAAGCIARDDTLIELTLDPGTYYFSLDTYVNGNGIEQAGEYTFVVLACELGDGDCLL